ncbi:phage integrase family protein [Idiomarina sp. A28L]|uniref:gamma-mobile-trio recombinase GmtY n=1 Tax=Idiomarina sp. A28L TaxID=1036674 RepID=UPI0002138A4D|nr:gamma-mobile-trio recombinase GmtY [Idiomarina sp. A28L]EGN74541.1 phage integrase family protein [Idiomarina sp. A28L]
MQHSLKLAVTYNDVVSGNKHRLPAVLTSRGLLTSHLRYLSWYSSKSDAWREKSIQAIRLLIDFIEASPNFDKATRLLKSFVECLVTGTIDYGTYSDHRGLYWKPRNLTSANDILFHITHYTDFLAAQEGFEHSRINPFRKATGWEERMNWCAYYHKNANAFLNHLSSYSEAQKAAAQKRLVYTPPQLLISNDKAERFPEDKIERLLRDGFIVAGKPDYRSIAMTMLLNYGGLRKSELFHIFTSDITINPNHPGEALVRVFHPVHGRSPIPKFKNRSEFLLAETPYRPRNTYRSTERIHAGWKGSLLTSRDGYFEVIFNPTSKAKEFLNVWIKYLKYQRQDSSGNNPFAFTNDRGEPDTLKNFQRRHKRAVERIGLTCKKEFGTTEHGHRHAYGYRSRQLGLTQVELQKALHHKSPNSCLVYIKPTSDDIRKRMRASEK